MSKFTWRIENFSQLDAKKVYSLTFVVNEKKWKLLVYPKGRKKNQHLSLYLCLAGSTISQAESSVPTKYSISILNLFDSNKTIKLGSKSGDVFIYGGHCWGWPSFMELSKFQDETEGYLVEDTCLIEAVVDISPAPTVNDSDSYVTIHPLKLGYIEAQSFLESLSKAPSSSASNSPTCERPLFNGHATFAKEIFDKLISYHLDDLSKPKNESAMMDFISTLADNISVFSDVQAREIVNLKAAFPQITQQWRDFGQVNGTSELPWSTFEKTISLLKYLVKREEGIRTELEELSKKETELVAESEAIECRSMMPREERDPVSKQMKTICCLLEERACEIRAQDCENQQLEQRLKSKWAVVRCLFAKRKNVIVNNISAFI